MNNPNPFVPQGSFLEQQSKRRSRMKLAVFCVLAVSVAGLTAMLIQGCKREQTEADNSRHRRLTRMTASMDTNARRRLKRQSAGGSPPPVVDAGPPVAPEAAGTEYVVVKGDTLGKIAKKNGVTLKALEAANPDVDPTKLKVGQKLTIPRRRQCRTGRRPI